MTLNYDSITALIRAKHLPKLRDLVFRKRLLTTRLINKAETFNTRKIVVPLEYGEDDNVMYTGEMETFQLGRTDPITAAEFTPKMLTSTFTISKEDELRANDDGAVLNMVNKKFGNLKKSITKKVAVRLCSRTAGVGAEWQALSELVDDHATTACGGIPASGNVPAWWKSNVIDLTGSDYVDDPAVEDDLIDETKDVYIFKLLQRGIAKASYLDDDPTIIILPQYVWDLIEYLYDTQKKGDKMNQMAAKLGFKALDFRGIPIVSDKDLVEAQTGDTDGYIYYLNDEYLGFFFNSAARFTDGDWVEPANQNSKSKKILAYGNMIISNRKAQCVQTGIRSPKSYAA